MFNIGVIAYFDVQISFRVPDVVPLQSLQRILARRMEI
jgi:hypothetical protein